MGTEFIKYVWSQTAPQEFRGLQIHFAPTRTEIEGVFVTKPVDDVIPRENFDQLVLVWSHADEEGTEVELVIEYTGETPQPLVVKWLDVDPAIEFRPHKSEHYREIYLARRDVISNIDSRQRCLFDLDRMTHLEFVKLVPEFSDEQTANRLALVGRVIGLLKDRVDERAAGAVPEMLPDKEDVEEITQVFINAERHLNKEYKMSEVLLDFAAGSLRKTVYFKIRDRRDQSKYTEHPYHVSEPDGGFVFLFGEFALVAHSMEVAYWNRDCVLDLIKMQAYFLQRSHETRRRLWFQYIQPKTLLSPEDRRVIDAEFAQHSNGTLSITGLEDLIKNNLDKTNVGNH